MRATITGPVALESCAFRHRGQLLVTVCATLRYRMRPEHNVAVLDGDRPRRDGEPVLAPFLGQADLVYIGSARADAAAPERHVRFSVRGRSCDVDRTLTVRGERGEPFRSRPVLELGPIAWEARIAAGALERAADGTVVIADDFEWASLQSAPPEQRAEWLHGDEWILLDGLHPDADVIHTRLPGWAPHLTATFGGTRGLLTAHADRLLVLGDESAVALSWRAGFAVPAGIALDSIELGAFVEHGGALPSDDPAPRTVHLGGAVAARAPRTVTLVAGELSSPAASAAPADDVTVLLMDAAAPSSTGEDWIEQATASANLTLTAAPRPTAAAAQVTAAAGATDEAWPFDLVTAGVATLASAPIPGAPWSAIDERVPALVDRSVTLLLDREGARVPERAVGGPRRTSLAVTVRGAWAHALVRDRLRPPRDSITLIVKASYALGADGSLTQNPRPEAPRGERFDTRSKVTPVAACELAPLKLEADVLLTGHAHAPQGRATVSEVALRFGHRHARIDRRFYAVGPRSYVVTAGVVTGVTEPAPFERLPLIHELAYGGPDFPANPAGTGHPSARSANAWALPCLEDPAAPVASTADRPRPACPAPVPRAWRIDRPRRGEFDAAWRRSLWPFRDVAFDPSAWQAAPLEQRLPALIGDEPFELCGVHPEARVIAGKLPGAAPAVFRARSGELAAVAMRLDTVAFDCDAMRVDLVWRAHIEVSDFDRPGFDGFVIVDAGAGAEDRARAALPVRLAPAPRREPKPATGLDRRGQNLRGSDWRGRDLRRALLRGADLAGACLAGADLSGADLAGAKLAGADLTGADFTAAQLGDARLDGAQLAGARFDEALLVAASFTAARGERVSFVAADLRRACFDRAELGAVRMERARVDGASFEGAVLHRAVLTASSGEAACFRDATLSDACADAAMFPKAIFDGARLAGSVWSKADLAGASLRRADLRRIGLCDADCRGAVFAAADLTEARLEAADCAGASFAGANLRAASLEKAILADADLRGANLFRVALWRADLQRARLDGAFTAGSRVEAT